MKTKFGRLSKEFADESSEIVILPVPFDKTRTWIKNWPANGEENGPKAILEASENLELYDIETDSEVYQKGILTDDPINSSTAEKMVEEVENRVTKHLKNSKFVVTLGGEHSVSIGSAKAHSKHYKDFCVLQLDAHTDVMDESGGQKLAHDCTMARIKEFCPIIQVGIRSMDSSEKTKMDKDSVFFAHDIMNNKEWVSKVLAKLKKNVYITIDLDVFDPSIMPSVGTPEPGGLLWNDVISLIRQVCKKSNLAGFDVVELLPNKHNYSPDFLAAKLIYKTLSYKYSK